MEDLNVLDKIVAPSSIDNRKKGKIKTAIGLGLIGLSAALPNRPVISQLSAIVGGWFIKTAYDHAVNYDSKKLDKENVTLDQIERDLGESNNAN